MSQPEYRMAMAIPDHEYTEIYKQVKRASRIGIYLNDKAGLRHRFYMIDNVLMADLRDKDDNKITREVHKINDILKAPGNIVAKSPLDEYRNTGKNKPEHLEDVIPL